MRTVNTWQRRDWHLEGVNLVTQSPCMQDTVSCISQVCSRRAGCLDLHTSVTHILSFLLLFLLPTIHSTPRPRPLTHLAPPPAAMHDGQARYCAWHLQQVLVGASFPYWIHSALLRSLVWQCGQLSAFSVFCPAPFLKKKKKSFFAYYCNFMSVLFTLKQLWWDSEV